MKDEAKTKAQLIRELTFMRKRVAELQEMVEESKRTENAFRQNEAQKQAILDRLAANVTLVNEDLEIIWANQTAANSVKRTPQEMVGHKCHEFRGDPARPCTDCPTVKAFSTLNTEHAIVHTPDGRIWDKSGAPVFDGEGLFWGVVELAQDITERKQMERSLVESEVKHRSLYHNPLLGIFHSTLDGKFIDVNPTLAHMLGYDSPEEVVASIDNISEQVYADPSKRDEVTRQTLEAGGTTHVENLYLRKDGSTWNGLLHMRIIEDAQGQISYLQGFVEDITERKLAEAALFESEKRFSAFMEHLPVGAFIKDHTGRLLFCNRYLKEFFGWREWVGKTVRELIPHEVAERMISDDRKVLTEGPMVLQKRIADIHGADHFFDIYKFPIEAEGSPALLAGIAVDVTERRLTEEQITQLNTLKERLIGRGALNEKLGLITKAAVQIYDADFARIWIMKEGDLCEKGCSHARVTEGPHVCRDRSRCLHLVASSGRYTHLDGNHRRVPLGAYKIGNIASGRDISFLTNDVIHDPSVHNHEWAETLGLVSFAGFRLISPDGNPIGVLALFKKQPIAPEEMRFLEDLANTTSQVIRAGMADEALKESEKRFRALVLNSSDIFTVLAADGTIRYQSPSLKRFFGYEPEDLVGKNAFPYVHPDDLAAARAAFARILEQPGTSVSLEYRFRHSDGSWIFVESVGSSSLDDPSIKGVVLNSRDISERKKAEEVLNKLARLLSEGQKLAHAGSWEFIANTRETHWSEEEFRIHGLAPASQSPTYEELLRKHIHPDDAGLLDEAFAKALLNKTVFEMEHRIVRPDGSVRILYHRAEPHFDTTGELVNYIGTTLDITDRKVAEEKLRTASLYARSLIEASLDPLVTISPEGKITDVNRATEEVTGVSREHLIGDDFSNYFIEPEKAREGYEKVLADGWVRDYPLTIRHASGKTTEVLYNATVYRDELGEMLGVFAAARDITERKRGEQALRESSQNLKHFAYSVAHDLKSPAIGLYGLTKRLSKSYRDVLDEKGTNYCDQILKLSEHIGALVDKVNVYIATKEARLSIERVDIAEILRMLNDEFAAQLSIRQIEWLKPETKVEIKADRLCMLRAFRNFLDNSLKYGGERLSKIWTGYEELEDFHIFSFSDNGTGLKEQDTERIFRAFQRNETSRGVEGAGLGLTIVKEIAEQHGGKVWVEPRSKKGITFCLSISKSLE